MKAADKSTTGDDKSAAKRLFFVSTLNMSWQLAIAVLVPVVGGYKLDEKLKTLPLLTIIGFIIAIFCMVIIVNRQLEQFK